MIEIFPWNRKYETGLDEIDRQHRHLVALLNRLANAVALPEPEKVRQTIDRAIDELKAYTEYHFTTEEAIWHRYFPESHKAHHHRKSHQSFIQTLTTLSEQRREQNDFETLLALIRFLARWLGEHILMADRRLALEVRGIEAGKSPEVSQAEAERVFAAEKALLIEIVLGTLDSHVANTLALIREMVKERELQQQLRIYAAAFAHMREGIAITDPEGRIEEVNAAFARLLGFTAEELIGRRLAGLFDPMNTPAGICSDLRSALARNEAAEREVWLTRKSGEIFPAWFSVTAIHGNPATAAPTHYIALFSDISILKAREKALTFLAHHDPLTGLPNRVLLFDRLQQAIAHAKRHREKIAVAYIDLDGFKTINDRHGHETGDRLLTAVARNLRSALRETDTLARIGGDEFVALLVGLQPDADESVLFQRLLAAAARPVVIDGRRLQLSASIGITFYPNGEEPVSPETLVQEADQAMYHAKVAGKNRIAIFSKTPPIFLRERNLSAALAEAAQNGTLSLLYQPIVHLRSGSVVAVEALLRWRHPDRGTLLPSEFLAGIEEDPILTTLESWVLHTAWAQREAWARAGLSVPVSINLSVATLSAPTFLTTIEQIRNQADLPLLIFELNAQDGNRFEQIAPVIEICRHLGIPICLDDFDGERFPLRQLDLLEAQSIKVAKTVVLEATECHRDAALLEGLVGFTHGFFRRLLAVGVASDHHAHLLLKLGCEYGQGFAISPPLPGPEIPGWVASWHPPASRQTVRPLARERLPLLMGAIAHREWMRQLTAVLSGNETELPPLDENRCRFGHWLQKEIASQIGPDETAQLTRLHTELHQLAHQAVAFFRMGTQEECHHYLNQLRRKSDALLRQLEHLEHS